MPAPIPSIFVVAGGTDGWDLSSVGSGSHLAVDSRMRGLSVLGISGTVPSILGIVSRKADRIVRYAECIAIATMGGGTQQFGLFDDSLSFNPAANLGAQTGAVVFTRGGAIIQDSVTIETVTVWSDGEVIGLELYSDSIGDDYVQFYRDGNPAGNPVQLNNNGRSWKLAGSMADTAGREMFLNVDSSDLLHIQSGVHPWGSFAQVSDVGGYSPAAAVVEAAGANITVNGYGRTVKTATNNGNAARLGGSTHTDSGFYLARFRIVRRPASGAVQRVGLASRTTPMGQALGTDAASWCYNMSGTIRTAATNSGAGSAYATGDLIDVIWQPSTGLLWFRLNSIFYTPGADPEAGTGADFTGVTGDLLPACSPGGDGTNNGIVEFQIHHFEFGGFYDYPSSGNPIPDYTQPWAGAALMPERPFAADIARDAEISQSIWYPTPWGGGRQNNRPIGNIVLQNTDRRYSHVTRLDLRDSDLSIFEIERPQVTYLQNDEIRWVARGNIERIDVPDEDTVTIAARGRDSGLDLAVPGERYVFGLPKHMPVYPEGSVANRYMVTDNYPLTISGSGSQQGIFDRGVNVNATSTLVGSAPGPYGFDRTTAVNGKQTASTQNVAISSLNARTYAYNIFFDSAFGFASWSYDVSGVPDFLSFDYYSTNRETYASVLGKITEGCITSIAQRDNGVIFFVPMVNVTTATATHSLTNQMRKGQCRIQQDAAPKLTNGQTENRIVSPYRIDEVAGAVSEADKLEITRPFDEVRISTPVPHNFYSFAESAPPLPLYTRHAGSDTTQLTAMLGNYEGIMQFVDQSYDIRDVRGMQVGTITDVEIDFIPNFTKAMVVRRVRRLLSPIVDLKLWGRA